MKVKQLIKKLGKLNQDAEVILSTDAEGNSYNYLDEIYNKEIYFYQNQGEVELCEKDELDDIDESLEPKICIILYPN